MGQPTPSGSRGKAGQPNALEWDAFPQKTGRRNAVPARAHFIALNTEVILPWSEPAKNWDRRLDRYKPAFRVNGRCQG